MYFKDWDFGNDEILVREIIKKCENRKLKQERRRRKQAMIKNDPSSAGTPPVVTGESEEHKEGDEGGLAPSESLESVPPPIEIEAVETAATGHELIEEGGAHNEGHQEGGKDDDDLSDDDDNHNSHMMH